LAAPNYGDAKTMRPPKNLDTLVALAKPLHKYEKFKEPEPHKFKRYSSAKKLRKADFFDQLAQPAGWRLVAIEAERKRRLAERAVDAAYDQKFGHTI
jgi:hypothetical protein